MNDVLVVTSKEDSHADHLISVANERGLGQRIVRLNTEDFLTNCRIDYSPSDFALTLLDSGRRIVGSAVTSVWYRRPKSINVPKELAPGVAEHVRQQADACLRGLLFCTHDGALWINPLPALHRARWKLQQLQIAAHIGLMIPETIVTNVAGVARGFASAERQLCTKSLHEPSVVVDGSLLPLFTQRVSREAVASAPSPSLEIAPLLLQTFVEKVSDIRVVTIGARVIAVEIMSQTVTEARVDFRGVAVEALEHREHELPPALVDMLRRFVAAQGLVHASIDLVLDRQGRYYFLECNPNGQWLWLESQCGVPLTDAMISLLFDQHRTA